MPKIKINHWQFAVTGFVCYIGMLNGTMQRLLYFIFSLLIVLLTFAPSKGQVIVEKFPEAVLSMPVANSGWIDTNIELIEIPFFAATFNQYDLLIENGYALHKFRESISNSELKRYGQVVAVDIIFTKYPLRKEDWTTNYYVLLTNRLKALFALDSTINSSDVQWRLVVQTSCKTEQEALKLFHGIGIKFRQLESEKIEPLPANPLDIEKVEIIPSLPCKNVPENEIGINDSVDINILYPDGVWNREVKPNPPAKTKKVSEPPCPKFTTRMDKPKRRLIDRILGR